MKLAFRDYSRKILPRTGLTLLAAMLAALFAVSSPGIADDGGCDPEYLQSLESRALMEAKRESAQNKNLIFKADSVLEYSCIFSAIESGKANMPLPIHAGAWDHIVTTPAFNFLANSFGHTYLGGRYELGAPNMPAGNYFCDTIARMWEVARCIDFQQERDSEGFYDFDWFTNKDPRKFPTTYTTCSAPLYPFDMSQAFNGMQNQWKLPPDVVPIDEAYPPLQGANGTEYKTEPVVTFLDRTNWKVGTSDCGDPIPTGLEIQRFNTTEQDFICAKPGCTYANNACVKD